MFVLFLVPLSPQWRDPAVLVLSLFLLWYVLYPPEGLKQASLKVSSRDSNDRKWSSLPPLDSLARTGHRLVFLCSSVSKVRDWNIGILSKLREIPEPESLLKVSWVFKNSPVTTSCYPPKMRLLGKDQRFSKWRNICLKFTYRFHYWQIQVLWRHPTAPDPCITLDPCAGHDENQHFHSWPLGPNVVGQVKVVTTTTTPRS